MHRSYHSYNHGRWDPGRTDLKVYLYCLCWNDARMLPFFFKHYDKFVDRYFIYDNGSTDASLDMLREHANVETFHFDVEGDSFVEEERRLGDSIWKGSEADWVIVTDIDEHAHHPNMLAYLDRCRERGVTAIQAIGYEMVADEFPAPERPLSESVTMGVRSLSIDRLCIFDPKAIAETNFSPGRHEAEPEGQVVWPDHPEVLLLHFKQLGVNYPLERSAELKKGLRSGDLANQWGVHYTWTAAKIRANWKRLKAASEPVPSLGESKGLSPSKHYDEERVIELSGLVDEEWYLRNNPDVDAANANPLKHYCTQGWKEGRKPNFYFDANWFRAKYPHLLANGRDPLYDFITCGETENAWPSPHFNTEWYRVHYRIPPGESPLRHYLRKKLSGKVSPNPDFKAARFCKNHPEILQARQDPFELYLREREPLKQTITGSNPEAR